MLYSYRQADGASRKIFTAMTILAKNNADITAKIKSRKIYVKTLFPLLAADEVSLGVPRQYRYFFFIFDMFCLLFF